MKRTEGMNNVLVITEYFPERGEVIPIGVSDSLENVDRVLMTYYHDYTELSHEDSSDELCYEWVKKIKTSDILGNMYEVTVMVEWFSMNNGV